MDSSSHWWILVLIDGFLFLLVDSCSHWYCHITLWARTPEALADAVENAIRLPFPSLGRVSVREEKFAFGMSQRGFVSGFVSVRHAGALIRTVRWARERIRTVRCEYCAAIRRVVFHPRVQKLLVRVLIRVMSRVRSVVMVVVCRSCKRSRV
jgi:hypothetical protein